MSNAKVSTENKDSEKINIVGEKSGHEAVIYFTGSHYNGSREWAARHGVVNKMDLTGDFKHGISSMVVLRGQCETTGTSTGTFNDASDYYNACNGLNNQGCWETLGSNDNSFTAIRLQRPDIERNKNIPYLILRNGIDGSSASAITLTEDAPSLEAFNVAEAIAVGSDTGKWYLYSEPGYKGSVKELDVSGGDTSGNFNDLGYYQYLDYRVQSVSRTKKDNSSWLGYSTLGSYYIRNEIGGTITVNVTFRNGDTERHYLDLNEEVIFQVDEPNAKLVAGNNQEVVWISLNASNPGHDIVSNEGSVVLEYNIDSGSGYERFEILRFDNNSYLTSFDDPIGVASLGPMHLVHNHSGDSIGLLIKPGN
ncbi:TPA: hypothetical protein SLP15_004750 [Klebsiella aerogenes]|nr:hypothetical protein [Klebsiella aerogenes]